MRTNLNEFQAAFRDKPIVSEAAILEFFRREHPGLKLPTLRWRLFELRRKGEIARIARGFYSFQPLKPFRPEISSVLKRIYHELKRELPYSDLCVWSTAWLDSLIVHQPASKIIIAETEKVAVQKSFAILHGHGRASFIEPTEKEIQFYILPTQESVVVKPLLPRSPVMHLEGVVVPKLEKILVDLFADRELFKAQQGATLAELFRNSLTQFQVDLTTLESYASRRGKRRAIRDFVLSISGLPSGVEAALRGMP